MPTESVPASAKIVELRLGIRSRTDDVRRGLNMKAPFAASRREMWVGQILWAGLSRGDMQALAAFFEKHDGRLTAFGVPLAAGFASQYVGGSSSVAGTLGAIPSFGAESITVSASGSPALLAGTLISMGSIDGVYQVCEVLNDTLANGSATVYIAPRIRYTMGSTSCTLGTVTGKFILADDSLSGLKFSPSHGTLSIDVTEAL